jgi:hypothetical protein
MQRGDGASGAADVWAFGAHDRNLQHLSALRVAAELDHPDGHPSLTADDEVEASY